MRAVSRKRAALAPQRHAAERALGREGTEGACAICGLYGYVNGHERLGRSQGGDPGKPDCLACPRCNTALEDNPEWAAWHGWKLSRKWPRDPLLAPNEARSYDGSIHTFGQVTV